MFRNKLENMVPRRRLTVEEMREVYVAAARYMAARQAEEVAKREWTEPKGMQHVKCA